MPDVSGDGQPDLIIADAGASSVRVLLGRSDGRLVAMQPVAVGCAPLALAAGTVSTGKRVDVVALCREPGAGARRLVNLGSQAGAPVFDPPRVLIMGPGAVALQLADVSGDYACSYKVLPRPLCQGVTYKDRPPFRAA